MFHNVVTFTQDDIKRRKSDLENLPGLIKIEESALNLLQEKLAPFIIERDERARDFIIPISANIRMAQARIEVLDLPDIIEALNNKIDGRTRDRQKLVRDQNGLIEQIRYKEETLQKLKIDLEAYKAILKGETNLLLESSKIDDLHSQSMSYEAKLQALKSEPMQDEVYLKLLADKLFETKIKISEAEERKRVAKLDIEYNYNLISSERSLSFRVLRYSAEGCIALENELMKQSAKVKTEHIELKTELKAAEEKIKTHDEKTENLNTKRNAKFKAQVLASKDQGAYESLKYAEAHAKLAEHKAELAPYKAKQDITNAVIVNLQINIRNCENDIAKKRSTLESHENNHFLRDLEATPEALVVALRENLIRTLNNFSRDNPRIDCIETRKCLREYTTRSEFLTTCTNKLAALYDLTGYIWSLTERKYADKKIKRALVQAFAGFALSRDESIAAYQQCVLLNPTGLYEFTNDRLMDLEETEYLDACRFLQSKLEFSQPQDIADPKLHAACLKLFKDIVASNDNKSYRTQLIHAVNDVYSDYFNQEKHAHLEKLAKLSTEGKHSVLKISAGGFMLVLAAAGGLAKAMDETSDGILKTVVLASALAISGGLLILSGLTKGLKKSLNTFAAEAEITLEGKQTFKFFQQSTGEPTANVASSFNAVNPPASAPPQNKY